MVTADHGQVEVGGSVEVLGPEIMDGVTLISGEGRFRWLHVRDGALDDVAGAAQEALRRHCLGAHEGADHRGRVARWRPSPTVCSRLGDVALVPFVPTAFLDPADTGELRLMARHGSLTADEMLIPLLGWSTVRSGLRAVVQNGRERSDDGARGDASRAMRDDGRRITGRS